MIVERPFHSLRLWVIVSVLLHAGLLLVPTQFFDVFFPREQPSLREGRTADPWPGFRELALVVVPLEQEPVPEATAPVTWEIEEQDLPPTPIAESHGAASGESPDDSGIADGRIPTGDLEAQFFPPVPRLIVPPTLEDLGITALSINVRILVTANGLPERVIIQESLGNPEISRRVLDCVRRFRFEPARLGDTPVSSWIDLPLVLESAGSR